MISLAVYMWSKKMASSVLLVQWQLGLAVLKGIEYFAICDEPDIPLNGIQKRPR